MKKCLLKLSVLLSCASYGYASCEESFAPVTVGSRTSVDLLAGAKHAASLGHYKEALEEWQRLGAQRYQFTQDDRIWYSDLLLATDNIQVACNEWARFFRTPEETIDPVCYYAYANALFANQDYASTVKVLGRYLAHDKAPLHGHAFMGQACSFHSKSRLLNPRDADAAYKKALHHCDLFVQEAGNCEEGHPMLEGVSVSTWLQVAKSYLELLKFEKAYTLYASLFARGEDAEIHPASYANAAQAALMAGRFKAAVKSWQRYFEVAPPGQVSALDYADMGLALAGASAYDEAFDCFQKYRSLYGGVLHKGYEFPMGAICLAKGDTMGAKTYYDSIFKSFKFDSQLWTYFHSGMFHNAARLYLSLGDVPMAMNVLAALGRVRPDQKITLEQFLGLAQDAPTPPKLIKGGKRDKAKRAMRPVRSDLTVGDVRQAVIKHNVDICTKRLEALQRLDVSGDVVAQETCMNLIRDLKSALRLDETTTSSASSSSQGPSYDLKKLQSLVFQTEAPVAKLSHLSQKQQDQKRTQIALEMLKARARMPEEVSPLPTEIMPRVRMERPVRRASDSTVSSSSTSSSSSSAPVLETPRHTSVPVAFEWLKTSEKDYERLVRIPGMAAKFQRFLDEIRLNPLEIRTGSGRPERLQADGLVFSRRFDKQNRMVYSAQLQADGSYKVTLLSLLGHYKHLANQLGTGAAASSS